MVGLPIGLAGWVWVMLNILRLLRVLPPFVVRRRSSNTAVVGTVWALLRGRGVVLREGEALRFTCNPAPRFQKIAGKAFMFKWNVKADGGQFSLLSPLALPPGSHWVVLEFSDRGKPVLIQSKRRRTVLGRFVERYPLTPDPGRPLQIRGNFTVNQLLDHVGGVSIEGGLYRFHTRASAASAAVWVREVYPVLPAHAELFGFDWLGRQFALTVTDEGQEVLIIDAGAGGALAVDADLDEFHDVQLVEHPDSALAESLYREWRAASGNTEPLDFSECVGFRVPLFDEGIEDVSNLALTDTADYWRTLSARARAAGR
jgi:hypothetical protein